MAIGLEVGQIEVNNFVTFDEVVVENGNRNVFGLLS